MNLFKPKRTFESVVQELIAGLEKGTIVLSKDTDGSKPKQDGDGQPHSKARQTTGRRNVSPNEPEV